MERSNPCSFKNSGCSPHKLYVSRLKFIEDVKMASSNRASNDVRRFPFKASERLIDKTTIIALISAIVAEISVIIIAAIKKIK